MIILLNFILCILGLIIAPYFTIGCILISYDYDFIGWCFIIYSLFFYTSNNHETK